MTLSWRNLGEIPRVVTGRGRGVWGNVPELFGEMSGRGSFWGMSYVQELSGKRPRGMPGNNCRWNIREVPVGKVLTYYLRGKVCFRMSTELLSLRIYKPE